MDTRTIWAVLAGGACATAGAGLVMLIRAEQAPRVAGPEQVAAPRPVEVAPLDRVELAALVDELRRLREELASRREAVVAGAPTPASDTLQGEIRELRALVERRAALAPAPGLDLSSKGPRRAELFVRSTDPEPEIGEDERLSKKFRLWSQQRVLDEFGVPDQVETSERTLRWVYEEPQAATATVFNFVEGHAAYVWVNDN